MIWKLNKWYLFLLFCKIQNDDIESDDDIVEEDDTEETDKESFSSKKS